MWKINNREKTSQENKSNKTVNFAAAAGVAKEDLKIEQQEFTKYIILQRILWKIK